MKTAWIFVLTTLCGLTFCGKNHVHLDYKTTDVAYPLRHKQYFDSKYKTSGAADLSKHKKYADLEERSSDVADTWKHKKYIDLEDRATDVADPVPCKSLKLTYNTRKHITVQSQEKLEKY